MKIVSAALVSTVALLVTQAARGDWRRPDVRASADRFERPQVERMERPRVEGMRPDALRERGTPVSEMTGAPRGVSTDNVKIAHGTPALRPDAKRDTFTPVDEGTGHKRGISMGVQVAHGRPHLRPDAKRDTFTPVDDMGHKRGISMGVKVAHGQPHLRPDAKRDAFLAEVTDEATGKTRGVSTDEIHKSGVQMSVLMKIVQTAASHTLCAFGKTDCQ